ncbi:hypothetical protein [Microtetraspora malaysiensis]|uniref:hypothetical protein n=1 Tax=Microtetraspora malaysiensis TaxID=161358 RepID=UPI003D913096
MTLRALVTGGGSGIGLATAHTFTARGWRVACLDIAPPGNPFIGVTAAIVYLAGPDARSATGTVLAVDGGMHGLRLRPGN